MKSHQATGFHWTSSVWPEADFEGQPTPSRSPPRPRWPQNVRPATEHTLRPYICRCLSDPLQRTPRTPTDTQGQALRSTGCPKSGTVWFDLVFMPGSWFDMFSTHQQQICWERTMHHQFILLCVNYLISCRKQHFSQFKCSLASQIFI